ncbi:MAG: DUF1311 domain-containing protein [Alphaproteobacteria bacterium]|nr:DUF1311 domain-containing protein [Alphaproteobacteria bacterium]
MHIGERRSDDRHARLRGAGICAHRPLNIAWRAAMSRMPNDEARSRLRQLQREWIKTRWAECDEQVAQSGMAGGTGSLLIHDNCQLGVIARRISWLEDYRPEPSETSVAPRRQVLPPVISGPGSLGPSGRTSSCPGP